MAEFSLYWPRAIDGYRIEPAQTKPDGKPTIISELFEDSAQIVPVSDRVDRAADIMKIDGVYKQFAAVRTEAQALAFSNTFGLLREWPSYPVNHFLHAANVIRSVDGNSRSDWQKLKTWLEHEDNRKIATLHPEIQKRPIKVNGKNEFEPEYFFRPASLLSAIFIQLFEDLATGAELRPCKRDGCGEWFRFGAGTGRRNTAQYCSPRCQKADAYEKSKGLGQ